MKKLTLIDKAFLLKRTPLFETLDLNLLLPIADKLGVAHFDAGETIFSKNEEAFRMYFVAKGAVEIRDTHHNVTLLTHDDFFGDESLFNDKPRAYSAVAVADTMLLSLSRTNLLTIISECPNVAVGFLQVYTSTTAFQPRKKKKEPTS